MRNTWILPLLSMLLAGFASPSKAEETPLGSAEFQPSLMRPVGWRGDGSGRFPGATPPLEWSLTKNVRWNTVVGRSYSSPVVAGKFVFVTAEPNLLICLNRTDGAVLWKVEVKPEDLADEKSRKAASEYQVVPSGSGMTAATPVTDGKNVYAVFANGIVRAVDLNGKPMWATFIDAEQITSYGRAASPIMVEGKLIVHMTNLYAFDPATGKQLWVNKEAKSKYGSPAGFKMGDLNMIVTPAGDVVGAADGKSVATAIGTSFNSSPIATNGVIYFCEKDIKAAKLNSAFKDEELWSSEIEGEVFSSPLLHENTLFTVSSMGELFAFDAAAKGSADPVIKGRSLFGGDAGNGKPIAYASITLAGKHLFLNTTRGEIVVLEATREAKQVAMNTLREGSGASPVFSGKDIFLRDGDKLFCIGE